MSILHMGGIAKENGAKRLEKLLSGLDRDRVKDVTDKAVDGARNIGERQETIMTALEDATIALSQLKVVETGLEKARKAMDAEFEARRDERSEVVALNAVLEHIRQELAAGGTRERDLQNRLNAAETNLADARAGRADAEGAASSRQSEIVRLTASFNSTKAETTELKGALEQASKQIAQLEEDNAGLKVRKDEVELRRQEAENKVSTISQAYSMAEAERGALERRAEGQAGEIGRLGRSVADLEGRLSAEQTRARALETSLQAAQAEANRLTQAMDEQSANTKVHLETAEMRLETAQARAARLVDENAEIHLKLQEAIVRDRVFERDLADTRERLERAETGVKSLETELTTARQELLAAEGARATAVERSERLNDALGARHADVKRLEDQSEALQHRIGALEAEVSGDRAAAAEQARALTDLIERERSDHTIAQGALEAARKDRARLHLELLKVARRRPGVDDAAADQEIDAALAQVNG